MTSRSSVKRNARRPNAPEASLAPGGSSTRGTSIDVWMVVEVSLAILDFLAGQLAGSQHDEQHIVIDVQLGTLVRLICVLDHQLVKAELGFEDAEQGLIRLVKTEPDDAAIAACHGADFVNRDITLPPPVTIECTGDNAPLHLSGFDIDEVEHISRKP